MNAPAFLWVLLVFANLAIVGLLLAGLASALRHAGWPALRRRRVVAGLAAVLFGWLLIVGVAGAAGAFFTAPTNPIPWIALPIWVPIVAGGWWLRRSALGTEVIAAVPQSWLVGLQIYRGVGAVFLVLFGLGRLPAVFALPAGFGDVAVGLGALVVAIAWDAGWTGRNSLVRLWNWLGILDLLVAVGTGFLSAPTPFQLFAHDAPNLLAGRYPLSLIPTFAVPVSILLHIASLTKLSRESEPAASSAGPAWAAK